MLNKDLKVFIRFICTERLIDDQEPARMKSIWENLKAGKDLEKCKRHLDCEK